MKEKISSLPSKGLQSRASNRMIYREDLRDLVSQRVFNKSDNKVVEPVQYNNGSTLIHQVVNTMFLKPLQGQQREKGINNEDILSKAISKLKPCLDLRQVRRGRKIFQIPRVIPPTKRQLFGMRQLLSTCTSKRGASTRVAERSSTPSTAERTSTNVERASSYKKGDISTIKQKRQSSQESLLLGSTSKCKWPRTREALLKIDSKGSLSPFPSSLSQEIRACSLSRSQSIENKKRIYKVAFTNRSSVRLAWWL